MRLVMLGTGPFAVPTLEALAASPHEVALVVARPPRGRDATGEPASAGGRVARPRNLDARQRQSPRIAVAARRRSAPICSVVCDYGEILRPATLATTRLGGINLARLAAAQVSRRGARAVGDSARRDRDRQQRDPDDARPRRRSVPRPRADADRSGRRRRRRSKRGWPRWARSWCCASSTSLRPARPSRSSRIPARRRKRRGSRRNTARSIGRARPSRSRIWCARSGRGRGRTRFGIAAGARRCDSTSIACNWRLPASSPRRPGWSWTHRIACWSPPATASWNSSKFQPAGKRSMSAAEFLRGNRVSVGDRFGPE